MKAYKALYLVASLGLGWLLTGLAWAGTLDEAAAFGFFILVIATLTFPLGNLGVLGGLALIYLGFVTQVEFMALATPMCVALGYLQWSRILPTIYKRALASASPAQVFE